PPQERRDRLRPARDGQAFGPRADLAGTELSHGQGSRQRAPLVRGPYPGGLASSGCHLTVICLSYRRGTSIHHTRCLLHVALPATQRQTWDCTATFLSIGVIWYALPWSVFAAPPIPGDNVLLRLQGFNTIGAKLGPALIKGMLEEQGLSVVRIAKGAVENEQQ